MDTIGITGGAGFIGGHLASLLARSGYEVVIFTRSVSGKPLKPHITYARWDVEQQECDLAALAGIDSMVHLAGAGVADKRWSDKRKQQITDSRVKGTAFLIAQLKAHAPRCKAFIAASATGYYGPDRKDGIPFTETSPPYTDFLGDTCRKWEEQSGLAAERIRTVILRFGIVLGKEGGAFPQFARPMSFGIMPVLGSGRQVVSWIEVSDLAHLILFAIERPQMSGIYNAVAPSPVTHRELVKAIAKVKGGIHIPVPVPAFALKLLLGEMSEEVLKSCTVSARKITEAGYSFQYPEITEAVKNIQSN